MNESLGFVEVIGLVSAVEAADAMAKAARVTVKTVATADAGLVSVICTGDLAAVNAAVDAGKAAATRLGECVGTNVIPRPGDGMEEMIDEKIGSLFAQEKAAANPAAKTAAKTSAKPVVKPGGNKK